MSEVVLDASALIAVLREEPGAAAVEAVLDDAAISTVNLSEVQAKLVERGTPPEIAWSWLVDLTASAVNQHLRVLRDAGLLVSTPSTSSSGRGGFCHSAQDSIEPIKSNDARTNVPRPLRPFGASPCAPVVTPSR